MKKLSISTMGYQMQELLDEDNGEPIIITKREVPKMVLVPWDDYVAFKIWQNSIDN